jgi:hypothetical protein
VHEGTQHIPCHWSLTQHTLTYSDLICKTSKYFKDRLQKHRKPVISTDECSICAETLDASTQDLSFCVKCGQNIHEVCIEAWKRTSAQRVNERDPRPQQTRCPMCRATWLTDPSLSQLDIKSELDPEAIQVYLDWLYTSNLRIDETIPKTDDAFNLHLLKLWAVAAVVQDEAFKAIAIATFFDEAKARFWTDSVEWAFVDRKGNNEIREFILDITLAYIEPGWFKKEGSRWPEAFVRELADAAMVRWTQRKSFAEQKKAWMKKLNVGDEEEVEETRSSSGVWRDENRAAYLDRINREASSGRYL